MEGLTYSNHLQYQTVHLMVTAEHVVPISNFVSNFITINYVTSLYIRYIYNKRT